MCLSQSQPVVGPWGDSMGITHRLTWPNIPMNPKSKGKESKEIGRHIHHHAAGTHRTSTPRHVDGASTTTWYKFQVNRCFYVFLDVSDFGTLKPALFGRWFFGDTELTFDADPPGSPSTTLLRTLQIFGETASGLWLSTVVPWAEELTLPWLANACCIFYFKATS